MAFTLRQWRNIRELSQKEAAEKIGIAELTLANYEKGISQPTLPTIKKILKVYDVKFDDIIFFGE